MNRNESIISAIYAKVGQSKRNNQKVMCHKSMKFSEMFGHNPPHTFDKFRENTFQWKMLSQLDLESKGQSPAVIQYLLYTHVILQLWSAI